jgi:release factor glutamine methyltransferase
VSGARASPRTVLEFLARAREFLAAKGIESARLDAEVLLAHVLRTSRVELYLRFERPLEPAEVEEFRELLRRRARRAPVAYLTGEKEFYSLSMRVGPAVLVPRPETEVLVEEAIRIAREGRVPRPLAADVGTGSGAIAVAFAVHVPVARVIASDRSEAALGLAAANASRHGVADRVRLVQGHFLDPFPSTPIFDLVLANPPYVDPREKGRLPPEVAEHEPPEALYSPPGDPLHATREIASEARARLRPEGALLLEAGAGTARSVVDALRALGYAAFSTRNDLSGIERVVVARVSS